jgi:hypothetical protein
VGSYPADPATNRLTGTMYDSNGNQQYANGSNISYDVPNRMTLSTSSSLQGAYEYSPSNKRVYQMQQSYNGSSWVTNAQLYYFYGITGQKLGTYAATVTGFGSGASMFMELTGDSGVFWEQAGQEPSRYGPRGCPGVSGGVLSVR